MEQVILDKLIDLEIKFNQLKNQMDQLKNRVDLLDNQPTDQVGTSGLVAKINTKIDTAKITLDRLLDWCNETAKDHHTLYFLHKDTNSYYWITNTRDQYGPHVLSDEMFDNHERVFMTGKKMAGTDLIYADEHYKIIIKTKTGLKRAKREELLASIITMIENGEFVYCEF